MNISPALVEFVIYWIVAGLFLLFVASLIDGWHRREGEARRGRTDARGDDRLGTVGRSFVEFCDELEQERAYERGRYLGDSAEGFSDGGNIA